MKWELPRNSLFAILLRSPWWVSAAVAFVAFALARLIYAPVALYAALPFIVIAVYAGWQQLRRPSAGRVAARLAEARAMSWEGFAARLEEAWRKEGYAVARGKAPIDLELAKDGRTTAVSARRWKAASTGVEPVRELHAATERRGANGCWYLAAGEVSDAAREFAARHGIRLIDEAELGRLLAR